MNQAKYTFDNENIQKSLPGTMIHHNLAEAFILLPMKDIL